MSANNQDNGPAYKGPSGHHVEHRFFNRKALVPDTDAGSLTACAPNFGLPAGLTPHNPEGLTHEQVGHGYRLLADVEIWRRKSPIEPIQSWLGKEWSAAVYYGNSKDCTYRVPAGRPLDPDPAKTPPEQAPPAEAPPAEAQPSRPAQAQAKASDRQEGGIHYKGLAIQPAEFITRNGLNFLEGAVVKRVCRHRQKGRAEDIRKAIHELQLILEYEYPGQ